MKTNLGAILSVDFKTEYSTASDEVQTVSRVCIDLQAIQAGLIKEVGSAKLPLLLAIISYMDADGRSFPSQRKLAELTGQSINTVNKHINELLEIEIDGQRLLKRELVGKGVRKKSMYYISKGDVTNSEAVEAVNEVIDSEQKKAMTSRDVAHHFADVYKETFGVGYTINYGKELTLIKNKLLKNYEDEALIGLIEVAVKQYKNNWSNPNYPLPTISMLCTWLGNKAYGIWKQEKDELVKQSARLEQAVKQDDTDKALDLFDI